VLAQNSEKAWQVSRFLCHGHTVGMISLLSAVVPCFHSAPLTSTRGSISPKLPIDATIIGIVDTVHVENKTIFSANG